MEREPIRPMRLTKVNEMPREHGWWYEAKWDGWRILGYTALQATHLMTRGNNDRADHFLKVAEQLPLAFDNRQAVVDGEMIALDKDGHQSLYELQKANVNETYIVFDLLELDGESQMEKPLETRRAILEETLQLQPNIRLSETFALSELDAILEAAEVMDMEGLVAKRALSRYYPGRISKDWLKWKFNPSFRRNWN